MEIELHYFTLASGSGDGVIAQILLSHELRTLVQCGILDEPMRIAAFKDSLSMLEILFPRPALEGRSLLHISAHGGSLKCLQYLENCNFDLLALDK